MGAVFWRVMADVDSNRWPVAKIDKPSDDVLAIMDATHRQLAGGRVEDWEASSLIISRTKFADMQPEVRGLRLCSPRFREVIDAVRSPRDEVQWLDATVEDPIGEQRPYFVLHFPSVPDLLDRQGSTFGPGGVIRQVFRASALTGRVVVPPPDLPAMDFILADEGRRALEETGATDGVLFRPALVSSS